MMHLGETQTSLILRHLKRKGSISFAEAWDAYGCRCLPRRIADLKAKGVKIDARMKVHPITRQRYARYHLVDAGRQRRAN